MGAVVVAAAAAPAARRRLAVATPARVLVPAASAFVLARHCLRVVDIGAPLAPTRAARTLALP
ncbi:MAG: hypothetical protein ACR2ML_08620 [Solirubrobacteraceae bacterium]